MEIDRYYRYIPKRINFKIVKQLRRFVSKVFDLTHFNRSPKIYGASPFSSPRYQYRKNCQNYHQFTHRSISHRRSVLTVLEIKLSVAETPWMILDPMIVLRFSDFFTGRNVTRKSHDLQTGVYGKCNVRYLVAKEDNRTNVKKIVDFSACDNKLGQQWSNTPPFTCPSNYQVRCAQTRNGT